MSSPTQSLPLLQKQSQQQSRVQYIAESCKHHAAGAYIYAQRSLDRVVEPDTRRRAYDKSYAFASTRPFIFSAAAAIVTFSALPVLLFSIFAVAIAATAIGGAVLFALFWLAIGLLVLIPTLAVASLLALALWAWAASSFVVGRAVYRAIASWEVGRGSGSTRLVTVAPQLHQLQHQPSQAHSRPTTPTTPSVSVSKVPVVAETKTLFKQPPPVPQYRPDKKPVNGHANGQEYTAIGRAV